LQPALLMKLVLAAVLSVLLAQAQPARAYSVLAHESSVDALWDSHIRPLLASKYPRATADQLRDARAYCYGGSVIQDLGYYPFGSHFFSNLMHYVRSGEFVEIMLRDARTLDEYAFAVGALAHYAADNTGHPEAVNRAVALMYPKLRAKYGDSITYAKSPTSHIVVEFSFDVVQAAAGAYASDTFHRFVGFKVAEELLERAFKTTYGLEVKDVFLFDPDLAIGTYRRAVSQTIPKVTEIAWRDHREEIERLTPGITRERFVFSLSRDQYEREYGTAYKKPGLWTRFLLVLYKLVPKIGPLKPLTFETPTREAEALFQNSLKNTRERFRAELVAVRGQRLDLANTDFDTGRRSAHGEYELADDTYAQLLKALQKDRFVSVPPALRRNILDYYDAAPDRIVSKHERKHVDEVRQALAALRSTNRRTSPVDAAAR
jgi:hypothetical protein